MATVGFRDIGLQGFAPKVLAHGHHGGNRWWEVELRPGDDPRYFQICVVFADGHHAAGKVGVQALACCAAGDTLKRELQLWVWSRLAENVVQGKRLSGAVCGVCLVVELEKFAGCCVTFHLPIPIIVCPTAKFSGDLGALFQRKPADGRFYFLNCAHGASMTFRQLICKKDDNAEGLQRASQIICG
ncbi:MAG: hypothetical protein ACLP2Y_14735 [Limisphaerales bacterium]